MLSLSILCPLRLASCLDGGQVVLGHDWFHPPVAHAVTLVAQELGMWLESLCVECKKMKRCLEISEKCANSDPSKIPTVDEITLMLNQTATTIQKVLPVVIDPRNDLTSSLYKWLKSQCVDCRQRKRCLQIAEKCADSDLSERSTVEEIFHMLNETQTTTQRIPTAVNEPRNDPRSSVYQWLKSLCVECKRKKESLEIAEKSANPDPSKRPSRDEVIHMLNETETTIRKVLAVVNEPINQPRSSLYQWLKSQCLDCKQKKAFLETVEKCAVSDPGKIHSIAELILMLNETETITQKIPQVRESSLYQWLESLCVDCREVKRCLETAQKFANLDPSEGHDVDMIFLMLNEAQTPPNVPGVVKGRKNDTKSPLYQWLESLGVDCKQMKRWLEISDCANSDPSKKPTMAEISLMHNEIEALIQKVSPDVNELVNDARALYKWLESLGVDCKQMKRWLEISDCANSDPSKRPTMAEISLMHNEIEALIQKVSPDVNELVNDARALYKWLESLGVDCKQMKRWLEISDCANSDPSKRPTMAEISLMHNEIEALIQKVSTDVNELVNDARALYKWLESLCVYFKRMKRCIEITKMCADRDPSKRPTVDEIFLMLNGSQTMRQKVLPVVNAPRNDTRSSLYQWLESLCVDCNVKKRFLEIAEKCADFDGPKRSIVDEINVMLNKKETMFPKVPRNDQQSFLYPWLVESLCVNCKQKKRCLEISKMCADSDPYRRPTMAKVICMLNETETTIQTVPPVVIEPRKNPKSSLYQVVESFRALPTQTLREYSRFTDLYKDLSVLEHVLEGSEKPSKLPYPLFQFITENFSDERRIGYNELGECFKGVMQVVAVTRVHGSLNISDVIFHRQIGNMMMAKHPNIIRFLGYCSDVAEQELLMDGEVTTAEKWERLLCFEYLSNGNLSKHIYDELSGLEWHTRYQIIKGICEGLCYLHKEKFIVHMDLKPASILLDDHMVPKITDFGISEIIRTEHLQKLEYSAPEINCGGRITSRKVDIYSLGVIIIELVTGSKKKPSIANVLGRWEQRWNGSAKCTPLRHQVIRCLELAESCLNKDPNRRPFVWDIIHDLNKMDNEANAYR
ncbi:hypothetical protein GQ55_8G072200 [Panicum hallii var. hallii]|uniref:Protein kinase domain-containing protein n=1 Tax=Panicum hallii var. hallii TaxID=1504633 RepID=A0A2T7CLJ9_9POAL|nr:hypothetical protein GQ55_8G072200 [Panicum hallii var. hallii]